MFIYICAILIKSSYIYMPKCITIRTTYRNLLAHSDGQASVPHCFHGRDLRRKAWPSQSSPALFCLTHEVDFDVFRQRLGRIAAQTAPGDFATPPSTLATSPCDANGWQWVKTTVGAMIRTFSFNGSEN